MVAMPEVPDGVGPAPVTTPVGAVLPAYRPDARLLEACRSVLDQVGLCVVVDDGPAAAQQPDEVVRACRDLGAVVVRHERNRGIAAALNTGIAVVRELLGQGAAVLTLDQDSVLPPGYVRAQLAAWGAAAEVGWPVGEVGPERVSGMARSPVDRRVGSVLVGREPIQSGLLLTPALLDLGGFDEALVIDGVDTEMHLRAVAAGLVLVIAPGTAIEHAIGVRHTVRLPGGRTRDVPYAADDRYYYKTRNRVLLIRRWWRSAGRWAVGAVAHDVRHLAGTMLVPGRVGRLRATWHGLLDGLRGRTGQRPPRRSATVSRPSGAGTDE